MKSICLLLSIILIATVGLSQEFDEDEVLEFWETNISPILDLDKETITNQTIFPLKTFDGDWDQETFETRFDEIFNESLLEVLKYQNHRELKIDGHESSDASIRLDVHMNTEFEGESFESSAMFIFKKIEGSWKLWRIDMAG